MSSGSLPPLPGHSSRGRLERVLRAGRFAVTAALDPCDSADARDVYARAAVLAEVCDAIGAPDAAGARVHMSGLGLAALLSRAGHPVVLHLACRDRNRIALQGDALGAAALGVQNVLCVTGDGVQAGDQPEAKPVFDLDAITLLQAVRTMRDEGRFLSGRRLDPPPPLFLGATVNPFAPPQAHRPAGLAKKIAAGAQFVQTQYCYDIALFGRFMTRVRDLGLHERCFILAGVGPLASARAARRLADRLPGMHLPEGVIERIERAGPPQEQRAEGRRLCIELIQQLRETAGVAGVHLMAWRREEEVRAIVEASGVLAGRPADAPPVGG